MCNLPAAFLKRMQSELGEGYEDFLKTYRNPPVRGVRVNTLKISTEEFQKLSPVRLDGKVEWEETGFYALGEGLGKTVAHAAGLYYVQEPSAMCAAPGLEVKEGERVLDLCAAPGGKSTQLAQAMKGRGVLVLNEINRSRAAILRSNVERLGVRNALITSEDPARLVPVFENYFDKILVDAPCSGEGMFKKEPAALNEWSEENVKYCAARQSRILSCADKMLSVGGRLVYSTCTFAPEEDELQIEGFFARHKNYSLLREEKLYPHTVRGEGHFCAVLIKKEGEMNTLPVLSPEIRDKKLFNPYFEWEKRTLKIRIPNLLQRASGLYYIPDGTPDVGGINFFSGVYLGKISDDGKRFEPSHTLAMCLDKGGVNCAEVDEETALSYLRGLTFPCGGENGWYAVTHNGYPLGWCKAVNGSAKNHLPKGLRI